MSKNNLFYVVNSRLTYVSTKLVMEWCGMKGKDSLFTFYNSLQNDMDFFLMDKCDKGDTIILVGFTKEINQKMRKLFKGYKVIGIPSDLGNTNMSSFEYVLKTYSKGKKMSADKVTYIKYMMEAIQNNFKHKESYFMNILFNNIDPKKFNDHFKDGWEDISKFGKVIKTHLDDFKKQPQEAYELSGLYFVNAPIKYYTDFVFKYHKLYDNLNLIDISTMKVYFKRMYQSNRDVKRFCDNYCEGVLGGEGFCSGKITKKFLGITKGMTNQSEII